MTTDDKKRTRKKPDPKPEKPALPPSASLFGRAKDMYDGVPWNFRTDTIIAFRNVFDKERRHIGLRLVMAGGYEIHIKSSEEIFSSWMAAGLVDRIKDLRL